MMWGAVLVDVILQATTERAGPPVVDLETLGAEFCSEVRHRRQHQMQALTMPSSGRDQRLALDEQHAALARAATGE